MKRILVTGCAGFIGYHTTKELLKRGYEVIGIDNVNDYYDIALKDWRLKDLQKVMLKYGGFHFYQFDIRKPLDVDSIFGNYKVDAVINLAAMAGVDNSIKDPKLYFDTNVQGTLNLLEHCKKFKVKKFVQASTSGIYAGQETPFKETLAVNTPISPYTASKKCAEVLGHTYSYLDDISFTALRFFTVYGPAGRPDMSLFRFIRWIDEGTPILLYGDGTQIRDFTYVTDIVDGLIKSLDLENSYEIINLGSDKPYKLNYIIEFIGRQLNKEVKYNRKEVLKTDIKVTWADISKAKRLLSWKPKVDIADGIKSMIDWYNNNKEWVKGLKL